MSRLHKAGLEKRTNAIMSEANESTHKHRGNMFSCPLQNLYLLVYIHCHYPLKDKRISYSGYKLQHRTETKFILKFTLNDENNGGLTWCTSTSYCHGVGSTPGCAK